MSGMQENPEKSSGFTRTLLISGIIFFILHFIFSWVWFQERMLQEDGPFYVVKLVQHQRMLCEHSRYSSFLIQSIPYLVMKSGASLGAITRAYSVAQEIYYFILFLFAVFILKNNTGALLLLLFMCLALGRDYFLPVGEYENAIMTSTVLFGMQLRGESPEKLKLFFAALILICCLNFHPVGLLAASYILLVGFLESRKEVRRYWISLMALTMLVFLLRSWLIPLDDYENNKMKSWTVIAGFLFHPGQLKSIPAAIHYFQVNFPQFILLFFLSAIILLMRKKFVLMICYVVYIYVLFIVFGTIKGADETSIWFGEYFILPGIPMIGPLADMVVRRRSNYLTAFVVAISILVFLNQLPAMHSYFEKRVDYVERVVENGKKFPEKRYIVDRKTFPLLLARSTWALPFQTLLFSSFASPDSAMSCIVAPEINTYDSLLKAPDYFLGPEWAINMFDFSNNKLRPRYFNLPAQGYRKLTSSQQNFSDQMKMIDSSSVSIKPMESILYSTHDSVLFTSVKITNLSDVVIPAIPGLENATYLCYHISDSEGKLIAWDNIRTPLEADVSGSIQTGLNITTAGLEKGTYKIEADLVTENKRWWGLAAPVKLIVK
jgi:hypothetical protein